VRPYSKKEKKIIKTGLVKWLKVKALNSSPGTTKKKNQFSLCQKSEEHVSCLVLSLLHRFNTALGAGERH
jgi:hypothetical protein